MPRPDSAASRLSARPIRDDEYAAWYGQVTDEYAADIATHGMTPPDEARRKADRDMASVLPQGLATPGQAILVLEADGERVGRLWVGERTIDGRRALFVWDVHVEPGHRGRGFGRRAMELAEEEARSRGLARIELNVFGGNTVARTLYRSLGYEERAVAMARDLGDSASSR